MRRIKREDDQERVEVDDSGDEHFYRKVYFHPMDPGQYSLLLMYTRPARRCVDGTCKTCG